MTTLLLVRHGRTRANTDGVLAGWTPDVELDERGQDQARALGIRMAAVPLAAVVVSPLERAQQTADLILADRESVPRHTDERVGEVHYGDWTGGALKTLAKDPLWKVVQAHPSAVVFPGDDGESLAQMQHRAVAAIRDWNARLGPDAVYVVVSHGDVIKAVLADALGLHLDQFQRLLVDPCSVSIVHYSPLRPFVARMNDIGGDLGSLAPPPRRKRRGRATNDAVVGGGAGA
jgi:probable phosphomutase (TIGR03848 family)